MSAQTTIGCILRIAAALCFSGVVPVLFGACGSSPSSESTRSQGEGLTQQDEGAGTTANGTTTPLVGYWPLNEGQALTAYDGSPFGNNLTLGSSPADTASDPTWSTDGPSLLFNRSQLAWGPANGAIESPTISIEAWVKGDGAHAPNEGIAVMSWAQARGLFGLDSGMPGGTGGAGFYIWDGENIVASSEAPAAKVWDGNWHHVAGTYDLHYVHFYLDGAEVLPAVPASGNPIWYGPSGEQDFTVGCPINSPAYFNVYCFNGQVRDVAVYAGARTAPQIAADANPAAPSPTGPLPVPPTTILPDASGVLPPSGKATVTIDDAGAAHASIPIWVPPGRAGIQPNLSLEYSSSGGSGYEGVGWGLSGLSRIMRCKGMRSGNTPSRPVVFDTFDSFCLDGEELVGDADRYHFHRFHDDASQITHVVVTGASAADYFILQTKDGRTLTFGNTGDSVVNVALSGGQSATMIWALSRLADKPGNFMSVSYRASPGGDILPQEIDYTGTATNATTLRSVKFVYDTVSTPVRPDVEQRVVDGQLFTYGERLIRLEMRAPNSAGLEPLRTLSLAYSMSPTTNRSLLSSIAECDGPAPAAIPVTGSTPLCRQESFTYAPGQPASSGAAWNVSLADTTNHGMTDISPLGLGGLPQPSVTLLDVDADGRDDLLYLSTDPAGVYKLRFSGGATFGSPGSTKLPVSIVGQGDTSAINATSPIALDFNGDGHMDVLVNQGTAIAPVAHIYVANLVNGEWVLGGGAYSLTLPTGYTNYRSADLNGDSRPDLLMLGSDPINPLDPVNSTEYYALNTNGQLGGLSPIALPVQPGAVTSAEPENFFVDLNNDGATDLLGDSYAPGACTTGKVVICDCSLARMSAIDIGNYLYGPAGAATSVGVGLSVCAGTLRHTNYSHVFGDFNGDGVADVIQMNPPLPSEDAGTQEWYDTTLSLGLGTGIFSAQANMRLAGTPTFITLDGNLDGKADLLVRATSAVEPYTLYSWQGERWVTTTLPIAEQPLVDLASQSLFTAGDVNGDGLDDFVAYTGAGGLSVYVREAAGARPDILTATSGPNGTVGNFGPDTRLSYTPYATVPGADRSDCQVPMVCVTRPGYVATEIDVDNGVGGMNQELHGFIDGRADALGWGFLGFKQHTILDPASSTYTRRFFSYSVNTLGPTPFYPYVGLPYEVDVTTTFQQGATSVTRTTATQTTYQVQGAGPFMALPSSVSSTTTDTNVSSPITEMVTTRTFDAYGNVLTQTDQWPLDGEQRSTTTTYDYQVGSWLVALPSLVSVTSTVASGKVTTRQTAYTYDSNGLLSVQINDPGAANGASYYALPPQGDGVQTLFTEYRRDANGMLTEIYVADSLTAPTTRRATLMTYDTSEGMFVVQRVDPMGLVTRSAYEPGLGVLAAQTTVGGVETTFQYDAFGRIRADHPAAGADRSVIYHAATAGNFGSVEDHRLGQYDVVKTLDSLQRTVATATTGRADGQTVLTQTTYDVLGRVQTTSRPYFTGATPALTTTTYDNLGRVLSITGADGSVQTTTYLGRTATTTNPDGNMSAITTDSLGRSLTSVQAVTSGAAGLAGHVTTTTSSYGPFNTLETSTDTLGNVSRVVYDRNGRPRIKVDPDSGARAFRYDIYGDVTDDIRGATLTQTVIGRFVNYGTSGGTDTVTTYDADGRVLTRSAPDLTMTYLWDTAYPGKLSSETPSTGTAITYAYDALGRTTSKTWNGPRGTIGYGYAYDGYDRLVQTTYPTVPLTTGGESLIVNNVYSGGDLGGELVAVTGMPMGAPPTMFWTLQSTDASESFPVANLVNDVVTSAGEDPIHPGWLKTITSAAGTTNVQQLTYLREGAGRVHERDDAVHATTETFGYDGLERLTSWNWSGSVGSRSVQYVYDDIGNLHQRQITAGPGASLTYNYGTNGLGPHQASSDSAATAYTYDSHGNQTGTPGRTLVFNAFDLPTSVTAGSSTYTMTYDGDLARFSRTDTYGVTRYSYSPLFEEHRDAAGTHDVLTVTAAGRPVAEIELLFNPNTNSLQSTTTNAILVDALGSVDAIVPPSGAVQPVKYDPFGARVSAADPFVHATAAPDDLRAGFTGHEHDDDVNLVDMIGRVYDPLQQRFLSEDPPAPSPIDGQAWNPYAYVRNNPLNATDPTGYLEELLNGFDWRRDEGFFAPSWVGGSGTLSAFGVYMWGLGPAAIQGPTGAAGPGTLLLAGLGFVGVGVGDVGIGVCDAQGEQPDPEGGEGAGGTGGGGSVDTNAGPLPPALMAMMAQGEKRAARFQTIYPFADPQRAQFEQFLFQTLNSALGMVFLDPEAQLPLEAEVSPGVAGGAANTAARFATTAERAGVLEKVLTSDGTLNTSKTVARQLGGQRGFIPVQSILDTIGSGARIADPQGVAGQFMYRAGAAFNGSEGTLEVLVDEASGQINHVLFRRGP